MARTPLLPLLVLALGACGGASNPESPEAGELPEPTEPTAPSEVRREFEAVARSLLGGSNPYLSSSRIKLLRRNLKQPGLPQAERLRLERRLGRALLKNGQIEKAIGVLERSLARLSHGGASDPALEELLAIAYLRQAETENCVARHNGACCIFPLEGEAVHEEREPAEKARGLLLRALRRDPDDKNALWLLNLCAMALGEYPEGVPESFRFPESAFASPEGFPRLVDAAPRLGLDAVNLCGGVVVEDFDGDGWMDLVSSSYDPRESLRFYRNGGEEGFEDRSAVSGIDEQMGGLNLLCADYDNDGDKDVFVLRGAWLAEDGRIRNSLVRNEQGERFEDVTRAVGLAEPARPTQTGAFGDFDGDGYLDLYVGNESRVEKDPTGDYPSQLFLSEEARGFVDRAAELGAENDRFCKGVAAGDYDADGDLDLYTSNIGANRLLRNDGAEGFRDVALELGVSEPGERSFATWFFDYDQDGGLDLFVTSYESGLADLVDQALGKPNQAPPPRLYRRTAEGFEDVTVAAGLDRAFQPMGANFGDLDHDGYLDLYLTTGEPQLQSLMPNAFLRNEGGTGFVDLTSAAGLGHLQKGHGVGFCDLDHDGDQDIYHQLGGFYPVDRFANALFLNPGNGNRFLYVTLRGVTCNTDAIGARVRVRVATPEGERTFHRNVGALSSFGGSPLRQEIGLGGALRIVELAVQWPPPASREWVVFDEVDTRSERLFR